MTTLLTFPAFWGFCGGLLCGLVEIVTAYSARAGNPLARRKAWLHLVLGVVGGPIVAAALTPSLIAMIPALDLSAISLVLGWVTANDPRAIFTWAREKVFGATPNGASE